MDLLTQAVGPLTLGQWIGVAFGIVVLFSFFNRMGSAASKRAEEKNQSEARCLGCGWKGKVSKYHRTCPRCGNAITRLGPGEA